MCLASVAPCIDFNLPPGDQMKRYVLTASMPRSLNLMKPRRLLQDSAVYFAIFIFHEFSFPWLCKTLVPINDLQPHRRCRKLIWAHLQTLWRPWSLIRFQRGFWGGRRLGTEKGKALHRLICLSFHFNIAHSDCSFFEKRPFALSVLSVNEGNLLNSISSFFLSLRVRMPVGFERYRTFPRKCIFMRDPGICFH